MRSRRGDLWRNTDFLKLWLGETVSLFGTQVTSLALPLTAVLLLQATPAQMGYLQAAEYAPFIFVTLFAGVWVDRRRRRPILIASNVGRAALLALLSTLAFAGLLKMSYMYLIAFAVGVLTVFFSVAVQSYIPSLVRREQLVECNSKVQMSEAAAEVGGPGLAGLLVEALTAATAILFDAASFLLSALSLALIRRPEPSAAAAAAETRRSLRVEIGEGLRLTFGNPLHRALAVAAALYNFFIHVIEAQIVLYATRELGIRPAVLGLVMTAGSIGPLLGSFTAAPAARRFGIGRAWFAGLSLACLAPALIPLARGTVFTAALTLMVSHFLLGWGVTVSVIHAVSLRQASTPDYMLGRVNASYRLLTFGVIPLGALLSGAMGERIGLRATLTVGAVGLTSVLFWAFFSPVMKTRALPE